MRPARQSARASDSCKTDDKQELSDYYLKSSEVVSLLGILLVLACVCIVPARQSVSASDSSAVRQIYTIGGCRTARTVFCLGFCVDRACKTIGRGVRQLLKRMAFVSGMIF